MTDVHRVSPASPAASGTSIARIEVHVLRWPIAAPVRTSFGTMHDRPAVLVRVEDADGAHGWGEAWCNFPSCGAEHRARLIDTVLAPLLVGRAFASPHAAWAEMTRRTAVLAIQSGEPGPVAQSIAGIDIALHDLAARRAGQPLWRHLAAGRGAVAAERGAGGPSGAASAAIGSRPDETGRGARTIRVYASGINPDDPGRTVERLRGEGYTAFKLKVGFDAARDVENLAAVRHAAGDDAAIMVDANQAWSIDEALAMAERLAPLRPDWLEEPLRADRPASEWQRLAQASPIPLAAGENAIGEAAFDALIAARAVAVVQPDLAKWGGVSGVLRVIDQIEAAGLRYCPHYLGAGVGLLASAHVLAARGTAEGLLEVDTNPNALRTQLCPPLATLDGGCLTLGNDAGLGVEPDVAALRRASAGPTQS